MVDLIKIKDIEDYCKTNLKLMYLETLLFLMKIIKDIAISLLI